MRVSLLVCQTHIPLPPSLSEFLSPLFSSARPASGPSGVGKTQLALKISSQAIPGLRLRWWLDGSSETQLKGSLLGYGKTLFPAMPCRTAEEELAILAAIKAHLERKDDWLIVVDDMHLHAASFSSTDSLDAWIPPGHGWVLMTCISEVEAAANMPLGPFSKEECIKLIQGRLDYRLGQPGLWQLGSNVGSSNSNNILDFLSSGDGMVQGLPMLVDSFAHLLAMEANVIRPKMLALAAVTDEAEQDHLLADLEEQKAEVLEASVNSFKASLQSAHTLPSNPRHLLGVLGSLQLWLARMTVLDADTQLVMHSIIKTSCFLGPAFPMSLLEAVARAVNVDKNALLNAMERLEEYGGVVRRDLRGTEVG